MSGLMLGLCALFAAYLADLLASHWGLDDPPSRAYESKRKMSSRLNGQPISRSPARSTGIRVP